MDDKRRRPRQRNYQCDNCGKIVSDNDDPNAADKMLAKKVQFVELGQNPKVYRSRIVGWLCMECVSNDPDFNLPERINTGRRFRDAP